MKQMDESLSYSMKLQKKFEEVNEKMDKVHSLSKQLCELSKNKGGVK